MFSYSLVLSQYWYTWFSATKFATAVVEFIEAAIAGFINNFSASNCRVPSAMKRPLQKPLESC